MKRLLETLKGARWVEMTLLIILLCILVLAMLGSEEKTALTGEEQMGRVLSKIEGAGRVSLMLSGEGENRGAVVICEGADDIAVMLKLQRSVKALTGLPIEKIEILKAG